MRVRNVAEIDLERVHGLALGEIDPVDADRWRMVLIEAAQQADFLGAGDEVIIVVERSADIDHCARRLIRIAGRLDMPVRRVRGPGQGQCQTTPGGSQGGDLTGAVYKVWPPAGGMIWRSTMADDNEIGVINGEAWIQTFTGRQFFSLAPRSEDVCLEDIAHALAMTCRYNGHAREFYSVAQHCVEMVEVAHERVGERLRDSHRGDVILGLLLHDAEEAYIPDFPRPIKPAFNVEAISRRLREAIAGHFAIPPERLAHRYVEILDLHMLAWERRFLMRLAPVSWGIPAAIEEKVAKWPDLRAWSPAEAEKRYLDCVRAVR